MFFFQRRRAATASTNTSRALKWQAGRRGERAAALQLVCFALSSVTKETRDPLHQHAAADGTMTEEEDGDGQARGRKAAAAAVGGGALPPRPWRTPSRTPQRVLSSCVSCAPRCKCNNTRRGFLPRTMLASLSVPYWERRWVLRK
jgi:hypothetical protein